MNIKITAYREALLDKGKVKNGRIIENSVWVYVCFSHAVKLSMQDTPIRETIDEEHNDYFMGNDRCFLCDHKEQDLDEFEKSLNDTEPEYIYEDK